MRGIDSGELAYALCRVPFVRSRPRCPCAPRTGYTLIELLVVMSIISVTASLTVPAVQRVREAAARTQCTNNLKQIGVAISNHESAVGRFPIGVVRQRWPNYVNPVAPCPMPYADLNQYGQFWPWSVFILPYMEGDAVYSQIDWINYPWTQAVGSTSMPTYQCTWDIRGQIAYNLSGRVLFCTTYLGVSGTNQFSDDGIFAQIAHARRATSPTVCRTR